MEEKDFAGCFVMFLIVILAAGVFIILYLPNNEEEVVIESKTIIVPTIKITIEDNKVDTLYIYKRK